MTATVPRQRWQGSGQRVEIEPAVRDAPRHRRLGPTRSRPVANIPRIDRISVAIVAAGTVALTAVLAARGMLIEGMTILPGYSDAQAHIVIARQVTNGAATGPAGFGNVWLPAPTALYAIFAVVPLLWQTGVAAVIVGAGSSALAADCIYRTVRLCGGGRPAGVVAALIIAGNPGWAYLAMTGMTEPVAFAAFLWFGTAVAKYALAGRTYSGGELTVWLGVPAAVCVLSRYEGWGVAGLGGVAVASITWARLARSADGGRDLRRWAGAVRPSVRAAALYGILPCVAAAGWVWHSWRVGNDPLAFARGERSARGQQELLEAAGRLPGKGNWAVSFGLVRDVSLQVVGPVVAAVAIVGIVGWAVSARRSRVWWAPMMVLFPLPFEVLSLWGGQTAVAPAWTPGETVFNVRYGLATLPLVAFGLAAVVEAIHRGGDRVGRGGRWAALSVAVVTLFCVTTWWPADANRTAMINEARSNLAGTRNGRVAADATRAVLDAADPTGTGANRETGAGIVAFDETANALTWPLQINLDRIATDSDTETWRRVTSDPTGTEFVLVNRSGTTVSGTPDRVGYAIEQYGARRFAEKMDLVWSENGWELYRRRSGAAR